MQHIAKKFVRLRREKPESGVRHPFEQHLLAVFFNDRLMLPGTLARRPCDRITSPSKRRLVRLDGGFLPDFGIVKNINISRESRSLPVDRDATRNVAVGATLCGQQPQNVRLEFTDWHGKALRSARRAAVHPCAHESARPG